jgi:amino-acid N-acetyltransferase
VARPQIESAAAGDLAAVRALLQGAGLPQEGVDAANVELFVARRRDQIVGCAALERHGPDALLRSVCVAPDARGSGVAAGLIEHTVARARGRRLEGLYLLTETAADYFPRFGFQRIDRADVPPAVAASDEFTALCPASAVTMALDLSRKE